MQVLLALEQDPSILARCGLTPACLPALVDHNPVIAVEASLLLMPSMLPAANAGLWQCCFAHTLL